MAPRACLPGEFFLDAAVTNVRLMMAQRTAMQPDRSSWAVPEPLSGRTVEDALKLPPFVALRWVLHPSLGIPIRPFTVWRRPVAEREPMKPIPNWHLRGDTTYVWDGITEMMRIELDVQGAVTALGLTTRSDPVAVASSTGGAATLVLQGGPMLAVKLTSPVTVTAARGLSAITMVNGAKWRPIESVGLPIDRGRPDLYYNADGQGPEGSPMSPQDAAINRLKRWGPRLGWATLSGLPPWQAPDPKSLIQELENDLLKALVEVMSRRPPPTLDLQMLEEVTVDLPRLRGIDRDLPLNVGPDAHRSEARVRPLSALASAVASDAWASLALGFGTGAEIGDARGGVDDFMVTAPWHGRIKVKPPGHAPFPFLNFPEPDEVTVEVERELAAVVLSPKPRAWPAAPDPVTAEAAFPEGAAKVDMPYRTAARILTDQRAVLPDHPRVAAFALARFDAASAGRYKMRKHPKAGGWYPLACALPVPEPLQPLDPALPAGKSVLRDSGVPLPVSGPAQTHQYAIAAVDLFGQWSTWATAWLSLSPSGLVAPGIASVRATAQAGAGNADPCTVRVTTEVTWEWRDRSCASITLAFDVYDPVAPPAPIPPPPPKPSVGAATVTILFDPNGKPSTGSPGVTVVALSDDGTSAFPGAHPTGTIVRRFRISDAPLTVVYAGKVEKAVAVYARGVERLRPTELRDDWTSACEAAIAPNPIAPATPPPPLVEYPQWASLPDPAGLSSAPVTWTPSGAPAYRVYVATEAALLAACGRPGPTLTKGYGARLQVLFDLYKDAANRDKLRSAYRKVDEAPLTPPVVNGQMRHEVVLPRGSNLIHCFIVVGLTQSNVVSIWPEPDGLGRRGFIPFAIPHPIGTDEPEVVAKLDDAGVPQVTIRVSGAVQVHKIRLYRTANARLARAVGTMDLIATIPAGPDWRLTTVADPAAPIGWKRLHYRAVTLCKDDLDHAGMAVPAASRADYALLRPPPDAPTLALTANMPGSTSAVALVAVATDAPREPTDIGDHLLSLVATLPGAAPLRFSAPLSGLASFKTSADLIAGADPVGYLTSGATPKLVLKIARPNGTTIAVTLDLTDPLGRTRRATLSVPPLMVDPAPLINAFTLSHPSGVVAGQLMTNAPAAPDPARPWTLTLTMGPSQLGGLGPAQTRRFDLSTLAEIRSPADLTVPSSNPTLRFAIGRLRRTGQILFWTRTTVALRITAVLANAAGQSTTSTKVSP